MPYISGKRAARVWFEGGEDATIGCGQVVGRTEDTVPVKELVARIMAQAEVVKKRVASV
jgi:hypothetical protein